MTGYWQCATGSIDRPTVRCKSAAKVPGGQRWPKMSKPTTPCRLAEKCALIGRAGKVKSNIVVKSQ